MYISRRCFFFFSSRRRHTRYWRDWSSDVCSSDLPSGNAGTEESMENASAGESANNETDAGSAENTEESEPVVLPALDFTLQDQFGKIGRASCRESVQISVVAVSLKKKRCSSLWNH